MPDIDCYFELEVADTLTEEQLARIQLYWLRSVMPEAVERMQKFVWAVESHVVGGERT